MTWPVARWLPPAAPAMLPAVQAGVPGGTGLACGDGMGIGVRSAGSAFQGIVPAGTEPADSGWSGPHAATAIRTSPARRNGRLPITDRYDPASCEVTPTELGSQKGGTRGGYLVPAPRISSA